MKEIIKIENLSKSFGDVKAVRGISFEVREGELFAFLGVNGAGKSTTVNILCAYLAKEDTKSHPSRVAFSIKITRASRHG